MSTLTLAAMTTLVFCAPGYPGDPAMRSPSWTSLPRRPRRPRVGNPIVSRRIYDPSEQGGLAKLGDKDSALAFVPYAFYVQHAAALHLVPLVQADVVGVGTQERWTLVGKAARRFTSASSMTGYTILSVAGYAPEFVKHSALAAWVCRRTSRSSRPADIERLTAGRVG